MPEHVTQLLRNFEARGAEIERLRSALEVTQREMKKMIVIINRLRGALQIIAGHEQPANNLMSNIDVAEAALSELEIK